MKPQSEVKCSRVANVKTSKCKVVKSIKPLVNFRFYLDIEKHNVSLKIESKIKELGGSIEFLLTKDVTHFITDKVVENRENLVNSPQPPASPRTSISNYSEIGSNTSVGNDSKGGGKIKSRADAMLQRARKVTTESERPTSINRSPSQVARKWGTPIWHTEYAIKYFEKVYNAIKDHYKGEFPPKSKEKAAGNAKALKGIHIKIESFHKQYRPYYQLLKGKWPAINLQSDATNPGAFIYTNEQSPKNGKNLKAIIARKLPESKKSQDSNMTRKSRSTKHIRVQPTSRLTSEKQCGFCEICRVEYDVLTAHLKTDEHVNFVKNDRNFLELDSLIKSSANVNKFLNMDKTLFNGGDCEIFQKRSRRNTVTNNQLLHNNSQPEPSEPVKSAVVVLNKKSFSEPNHFPRYTRQSFSRQSISLPPTSQLTRNDDERKLRTEMMSAVVRARRESVKKVNYAEPGEEDLENSDDAMFPSIQRKRMKAPKPPVLKIKAEESPEVRSKRSLSTVMYKVVNTKVESASERKEPLAEKNSEQPAPLIVKFRKVRQTELAILNGEAVNFMFPPKISSDVPTDVDRHTTSEPRINHTIEFSSSPKSACSPKRKASLVSQCTDDSRDSSSGKRKKLNNSLIAHASADATSQETVASTESERRVRRYQRRRFRRAPIQSRGQRRIKKEPVEPENTTTGETTIDSSPPEDGMGENEDICDLESLLKNELGKYKFAFERVPLSEPWYGVFQRQDECKEEVFEYYGNTVYRKLPYEMGPLPPLPSNCSCISKSDGDKSLEPENPAPSPDKIDTPAAVVEKEESVPPIVENSKPPTVENSKLNSPGKKSNVVNHAATLFSMEMPRKSPRDHPSTLAILSCLINRRPDRTPVVRGAEKSTEEATKSIHIDTTTPTTSPSKKPNKDESTLQISPQIGESVKRLRRGEKLLEIKKLKNEKVPEKPPIVKRTVGRPRKHFGPMANARSRKLLESNQTEKPKTFYSPSEDKYVNINHLDKQIDLYLSSPLSELAFQDNDEMAGSVPLLENNDEIIDHFQHELDLNKLVCDGSGTGAALNSFNTIVTKTIPNKLRFYKLFSQNKKVKVNRTGWPKKRRVITRQQNNIKMPNLNGLASIDISNKFANKLNNEINIAAPSPMTPPETDVEEKNECDHNSIPTLRDESTNLTFASDRADNSDMFTVSSDSLDTVLDVGSQIKTEVQKEIIASRKCKVNICSKLPQDIKIRKSSRISFRKSIHPFIHRIRPNIKVERMDVREGREPTSYSSCSPPPRSLTPSDNNMKTSSSLSYSPTAIKSTPTMACPVSPRRLRKPRGRWYRER